MEATTLKNFLDKQQWNRDCIVIRDYLMRIPLFPVSCDFRRDRVPIDSQSFQFGSFHNSNWYGSPLIECVQCACRECFAVFVSVAAAITVNRRVCLENLYGPIRSNVKNNPLTMPTCRQLYCFSVLYRHTHHKLYRFSAHHGHGKNTLDMHSRTLAQSPRMLKNRWHPSQSRCVGRRMCAKPIPIFLPFFRFADKAGCEQRIRPRTKWAVDGRGRNLRMVWHMSRRSHEILPHQSNGAEIG